MKRIYETRQINGQVFMLAEHLDNYVEAQIAAVIYRCEGLYCRVERVDDAGLYYIWTAPGRLNKPRLLEGEEVSRESIRFLRSVG